MSDLTTEGRRAVAEIADRHGVSVEAAAALLDALRRGDGYQAQFSHPDLGGMGQWSQGGMLMIGDMFNHGLKARVAALCQDLSGLVVNDGGRALFATGGASASWWPAELGSPASAGAQNDMAYAYFPGPRRLAIQQGGRIRLYDTGEHAITGVSQAQSGDQTLTFSSQRGTVRAADLVEIAGGSGETPEPPPSHAPQLAEPAPRSTAQEPLAGDAIFAALERLAELHRKGILSDEEFATKKRELLSRL